MRRTDWTWAILGAGLCLAAAGCSGADVEATKAAKPAAEAELPPVKTEDLQEGKGEPAKEGDWVLVHYTGWLTDGTKFDSSLDRQEPFRFRLGARQVIRGWDKGVTGMKPGGKRKLTIPPEQAYGKEGQGKIPPNSTLVFEIDLLRVE